MNIIESNLVFKSNMSYGNAPDEIVLHHAEATNCTIQDIHAWHLANGWAGCGYHFLVRKDGTIYRGRPEAAIGSHCPSANTHSIGICAEGAFMTESMSDVQKASIIWLCEDMASKYHMHTIYGHRELYSTSCPADVVVGGNFPLASIKSSVAGIPLATPVARPVVSIPTQVISQISITSDIKSIQTILNALGENLVVDGSVGPKTIAAAGKRTLEQGQVSDEVKWLQLRLISKGYNCGKAGADSDFGSSTLTAVEKFQTDKKLTADGSVGINTFTALLS